MSAKKIYRINIEVLLKIISLLGFSSFFYYVIRTNKVQYYVHPRIIPYMKFAIVSFIIISLFFSKELFKVRSKNNKVVNYVIFIVPLIISFVLPPKTMISTSVSTNNGSKDNVSENNFIEDKVYLEESNIGSLETEQNDIIDDETASDNVTEYESVKEQEDSKLTVRDNTIIINDDSFMAWVDELFMNIGKYEGHKVEIVGSILKDGTFKQNEFIVARLLMVCCAADMQPVGFLCRYDKASELEVDSWAKIKGVIKYEEVNGEEMPIIELENIENVDKPENEFLYPY